MSLAEIEDAVKGLSREELAKLAGDVARVDKLSWDEQIRGGLFFRRQARVSHSHVTAH